MTIALISDIHGNYEALKEVLKKIYAMGIKEIYSLGDVVGYYSQVNECCDELRKRDIKSIMGNHDWYMAAGSFCPRSNSVNDCLAYQRKVITQENFEWVCKFPVFLNINGLSIVHGSWSNPIDEYFKPTEAYFEKIEGTYFSSGHTHRQVLNVYENKAYCNPGSVGQPRDHDPRAAFATFDGKKFELHRVEYDIDKVGALMEKAGFSAYYYSCLNVGAPKLGFYNNE